MTAPYTFDGLTDDQAALLTMQGWRPGDAPGFRQPSPASVAKLVERGLVEVIVVGAGGLSVTSYHVPLDVHMAWCRYCADRIEGEQQ
jgi:hypothetical protein